MKKLIRMIGLCTTAGVFGIGAYYFLSTPKTTQQTAAIQKFAPTMSTLSHPEATPAIHTSESKTKLDISKIDSSKPITVDGKSYMLFSPAEIATLQNWMSDRGYFDEQDKEVYNNYSDEVLQELGKKGDTLALHILTNRAVNNADSKSAAMYMTLGAIYGSTADLDGLTNYTAPNSTNDATEELRRPSALETLAVTKVIALRGDKSLSKVSERGFVNSYKNLYGVDLKPTPEEEIFVANRAQEIYNKLQEIRTAKGLGDFDNSSPSEVEKFLGGR